jgi:predicted dehydrogenase
LRSEATTQRATAEEAARTFGAETWFASASELINDPEVDLVVVAVKVTAHYDIVREALNAGKHVYCEWPLVVTATEAESLATLARSAGVVVAVDFRLEPLRPFVMRVH